MAEESITFKAVEADFNRTLANMDDLMEDMNKMMNVVIAQRNRLVGTKAENVEANALVLGMCNMMNLMHKFAHQTHVHTLRMVGSHLHVLQSVEDFEEEEEDEMHTSDEEFIASDDESDDEDDVDCDGVKLRPRRVRFYANRK